MPTPEKFNIIFLLLSIFFFVFSIKRPVYGVLGYIVLVYGKVSLLYPILTTLKAELILGLLLLIRSMIYHNGYQKILPSWNSVNKYLFLFIGAVFLSFIFAWDHAYSWDIKVYHFIKVLFLYFMLVPVLETEEDIKVFIWSFLGFYTLLSYEPFYGFITGTGGDEQTYGVNYTSTHGLLAGHVALANNMNQMIPLALFLFFAVKEKSKKIISLLPLLIFIVALIGSGSRGGVVGFGVFSVVVAFYSENKIRNLILMGLVVGVLFVASGSIADTAARIDASSTGGRLVGLTHGIGILLHGNIFGVGPGCYLIARQAYFGWYMESHNIYGQVIGDLGIPGIIIWGFFIYHIFKNLLFVQKNVDESSFLFYLSRGIQISLIVRLAISMASHGLYFFYWYIMAALSIMIRQIVENEIEEEEELPAKNQIIE